MKIFYWNFRGIANCDTQNVLFDFCKSSVFDILCLDEPKCEFSSISPSFWKSLNLKFLCFNDNMSPLHTIWIFHSKNVIPPPHHPYSISPAGHSIL